MCRKAFNQRMMLTWVGRHTNMQWPSVELNMYLLCSESSWAVLSASCKWRVCYWTQFKAIFTINIHFIFKGQTYNNNNSNNSKISLTLVLYCSLHCLICSSNNSSRDSFSFKLQKNMKHFILITDYKCETLFVLQMTRTCFVIVQAFLGFQAMDNFKRITWTFNSECKLLFKNLLW